MAKKAKKLDNGNALYLGTESVKKGKKGTATRVRLSPKDQSRDKRLSEAEQRKMDVARKKFQKSHKPASGNIESFGDELGRSIVSGGRGFGVRGRGLLDKGYGKGGRLEADRDRGQDPWYGMRAKTPAKTDPEFIRKAKVKKSIVKK